jgi:hypothetical protein
MSFGSKKKKPRYAFVFLSKSPSKRIPFRFPNRALMEGAARLQELFYIYYKFLIKMSLTNKFFPSLKGPRKGASSMFPKSGALTETDAHFQSLN